MIVVSVAAVSGRMARRTAFGGTGVRTPPLTVARTTCGSNNVPPLAITLAAAAICSGVTPIW